MLRHFRMFAQLTWVVSLVLVFCLMTPVAALAANPHLTEARSACLVDSDGKVLYAYNEYEEMPMASTTKIMTAMVALDSDVDMDTVITISDSDVSAESQLAGFLVGDKIVFRDLLRVMLVYSANDAAVNVGRAVAGSDTAFVKLMNKKAEELGLEHTHFKNAHGLEEEGHYSCAADLCTMGRYAMENYDFIAETVALESVTVPVAGQDATFESTDALLGRYYGARGIKTGKTETGCSFLGACERDGIFVYSAVMNCATNEGRFTDTEILWDWAWKTYYQRKLASSSTVLSSATYAFNPAFKLTVRFTCDVSGVVNPKGEAITYERTVARKGLLTLPGQSVGVEIWRQGTRVVAVGTIVAAEVPSSTSTYNPPVAFLLPPSALEVPDALAA